MLPTQRQPQDRLRRALAGLPVLRGLTVLGIVTALSACGAPSVGPEDADDGDDGVDAAEPAPSTEGVPAAQFPAPTMARAMLAPPLVTDPPVCLDAPTAPSAPPVQDGAVTGEPAPSLSLPPVGGGAAWTFGSQRAPGLPKAEGHLVAFVASWCAICASALPTLRELEVANPTLEVVFVTVDATPAQQAAEQARVRAAGMTGPVLVSDPATRAAWMGTSAVPRYVFVDGTGRVRSQDRGFSEEVKQMMPAQARRVLSGASSSP